MSKDLSLGEGLYKLVEIFIEIEIEEYKKTWERIDKDLWERIKKNRLEQYPVWNISDD